MPKEYIVRDAVIKKIKEIYCTDCNNYDEVRCRACQIDDALNCIDDFPVADVAPVVHGGWIDKGEFFPPCHYYECSVCKKLERMAEHKQSLFCPNCGAKMDGETHEKI